MWRSEHSWFVSTGHVFQPTQRRHSPPTARDIASTTTCPLALARQMIPIAARFTSGAHCPVVWQNFLATPERSNTTAAVWPAIALVHAVHLLDLRGAGALRAGVDSGMTKNADRAVTQRFSRYVYDSVSAYGTVDGIIWPGAKNDEDVIVLYERAESTIVCIDEKGLDDPVLRPALIDIGVRNNIDVP